MINIFVGKPKKLPESEMLDAGFFGVQKIIEMLQSPDLFGQKKTYRITNVESSEEIKKEFFEAIAELGNTPNDMVIVLEKLLVADRKILEKNKKNISITETKAEKKSDESFNAFALGNAFASGDKKKTWMVFQELLTHDDEMEKTHGLVWWKLKDMMQKKGLFSESQLQTMARDLVNAYHESRLGGLNLEKRLELFFLSMPEIKK